MNTNGFPQAYKTVLFVIEDEDGVWKQIPYREAKDRPDAVRASSNGKNVSWFVPVDPFGEGFGFYEGVEDDSAKFD